MNLEEQFNHAVVRSKELTSRPSNEDLLKLYAYYKQATEGDIQGERPGGFDFKGAAKFDAWQQLAGTNKNGAMESYIALVNKLHNIENQAGD